MWYPEDRDFVSWLTWIIVVGVTATFVVLGLMEAVHGQQGMPAPPRPVPKQIQLRHFPLEGTNSECVAAVTTQDAAPDIISLPQRPVQETFQWIGCFDRKSLGITPTPSPEPTKAKVS